MKRSTELIVQEVLTRLGDRIPAGTAEDVMMLIRHNEPIVGVENLCAVIEQTKVLLSSPERQLLVEACEGLSISAPSDTKIAHQS